MAADATRPQEPVIRRRPVPTARRTSAGLPAGGRPGNARGEAVTSNAMERTPKVRRQKSDGSELSLRVVVFIAAAAGLVASAVFLSSTVSPSEVKSQTSLAAAECSLYLAPSSIPDGGLGLYSAAPIAEGDMVGLPDVCHQLIDMIADTELDNYRWDATSIFADGPFEGRYVQTLCPGFGMAVNSHAGLANVELREPPWPRPDDHPAAGDGGDSTRPSTAGDPLFAGAETAYFGVRAVATADVPAGSELFLYYGRDYFETRASVYGDGAGEKSDGEGGFRMHSAEEYAAADAALSAVLDHASSLGGEATERVKASALALVRSTLARIDGIEGAAELVPRTFSKAEETARVGTARASLPGTVRSVDWLDKNGRCVDRIQSAVAGSGDGASDTNRKNLAFAQRPISEGEVVTTTPLAHFTDPSVFEYNIPRSNGKSSIDVDDASSGAEEGRRTQQIINYCFGHPESTVLLYPYGPGSNLIRCNSAPPTHNDENDDDDSSPFAPNVVLRWSTLNRKRTERLLSLSAGELVLDAAAGLVADFVALRDIAPGEEVTIDCGSVWHAARADHTERRGAKPTIAEDYVDPAEFNRAAGARPVRTADEQRDVPYPSNIRTACYYDYEDDAPTYADGSVDWGAAAWTERSLKGNDDGRDMATGAPLVCAQERRVEVRWEETDRVYEAEFLRPCDVLERWRGDAHDDVERSSEGGFDGGNVYTVRMLDMPGLSTERLIRDPSERHVVTGVPRHAVRFVHRMYSSDAHWEGAFRCPMGLPEGMVPARWRNVRRSQSRAG